MQPNDLTVRILIDIRDQITAVNARLETVDARLETVDARLETVDARLDHLEGALFVEIGALHATLTDVADVSCERDIAGLERVVGQEEL